MTERKPRKEWTAKDDNTLQRLWQDGVAPKDIANILERSADATKMRAYRLNIGIHPNYALRKSAKVDPTKQPRTEQEKLKEKLKKELLAEQKAWLAMVKAPPHLRRQAEYNLILAQQAEQQKADTLWPKMKNRE